MVMMYFSEMTDSLRLLGGFELVIDNETISLGQPRIEEFVAFLAVHQGETYSRSQIAYRFWPDSSEKQARTNTRQLLFKLKQAWNELERVLSIDRSSVTWRTDVPVTVDVHFLDHLMERAEATVDPVAKSALFEQAACNYRGDFLPDCFSDWALAVREQLNTAYSALLLKWIETLLDVRDYEGALTQARNLIDHDPVQEAAYRRLMQVHMAFGDRAAALRVYHTCASMLQKELGVEPSPATMQMRTTLLRSAENEAPASETPRTINRPRLIGRHRQWQQLKQAWSDAQQGNAQCVLIWGEAGIGKTRLAQELIDWVRQQGQVAVSSRSYAAEGALTYAPITEWLRHPTIQPIVKSVDALWQVELSRLLPELLIENRELPAPGPLTEAWQQLRFYQSIVHVLQAVPGPLLLHLDDMQWSDQDTLYLMHFLLHNTRNKHVLLMGTIRTEDATGNASLHELAETLRHANQLNEFVLTALTEEESIQLAELTVGEPLSSERNALLYEASEGHPLYLIESLRSDQTSEPTPVQRAIQNARNFEMTGEPNIPPRIFQLLSSRLYQLSPEAQMVASAASVIGHSFTYALLKAVTDMEEAPLVDVLDELWTRRIIHEQSGDSYDFSHDRIREVAYQQISRTRRRLLHRTVGESLESVYIEDLDIVAGELAKHFFLAGDSYRAYQYYRKAANVALKQYALARADELFTAALTQLPDDGAERILALSEQSAIFSIRFDLPRWKANIEKQHSLLNSLHNPPSELVLETYIDTSRYYAEQGEGRDAQKAAQIAVTEAKRLDEDLALARAYQVLARSYWLQSAMAKAANFFGLSREFAHRAGNGEIELTSVELQAAIGMFSGMPPNEIRKRLTDAYAIAEAIGNIHHQASLNNKFGYLTIEQGSGEFDLAEQEYRQGLAVIRDIGDRSWEHIIFSNLGKLFDRKGDYRQAMGALTDALENQQDGVRYWRSFVIRHHIGASWMEMGRLDAAQKELTVASNMLHQLGNHHFETRARCDLGLAHFLSDECELALRELNDVLELVHGHGDLRFEALICTRLGYVYEVTDQLENASNGYRRGYDLHNQMEQYYYAMNALAGSARVAQRLGANAVALDRVETIWRSIEGQSIDATVETAMTLRTCYCVFDMSSDPRKDDVLRMAWAQLCRRADSVDDGEYLERYWQLAPHAFFRRLAVDASPARSPTSSRLS